ncbi:uroporphyrinogen-III C-methyltransferase [Blastopirellula sp. JC732]|uniref:uroporphyrinogen-III C-methyltransferase n=1 Tax=Blastopirellula sediminis TaxID=2894196 RepID=A0A9X1SHP3_9BACT|nr:uroporphyrinogen-III C-methyltransferase [Blastopirellula sediminis]MCC9605220.1 uroporphyrinogen-III C-methyltransferase [Blastopirellula sediminis]MCC9631480.1 uroporphyrinogen-III C-methyltransferase [Blastopirellula sediminis]
MPEIATHSLGKASLVGAGPGDAGLITLRGVELLAAADVVLYDYLANPSLLRHVRSDAQLHCLGRHGHGKLWTQQEINQAMVEAAQEGLHVVRLKSGDPTVFARAADEIEALKRHGIPFEIVPGVTTALAAGACAGVPVTDSRFASAVALVTGREKPGKSDDAIDYAALAKFPGTLVMYMGVTSAPAWSAGLIAGGKSPDTPCAIIRRCSWPDQETYQCTLGEIGEHLHSGSKIRPPVIVVVGEVAREASADNWFQKRPLFGQRVLITRPEHQADGLAHTMAELGADVYLQPAIQISPPHDWSRVDDAIRSLHDYDWLVFSSANGVRYFFERLFALGDDLRAIGHMRIAAIGSGTADTLAEYHLNADVIPAEYRAESLVASLKDEAEGQRFLLPRASRGRDVLPKGLADAGGDVTEIVVYQSDDCTQLSADVVEAWEERPIDYVLVTSSAIARATVRLLGDRAKETKFVSISPITSDALREVGVEPSVEATVYSMDGVLEALQRHVAGS